MREKDTLVDRYLENISGDILKEYRRIINKYVGRKHGIYALYRKGKLYYVGLASNLRGRLNYHLRDRHANTWDSFCVYLTKKDYHMPELEALLLRIITPKGNLQKGKFRKALDLKKDLKRDIVKAKCIETEKLFCNSAIKDRTKIKIRKKLKKAAIRSKQIILQPFIKRRTHIRLKYKNKLYIAHVRKNGTIKFANDSAEYNRLKNRIFKSPSLAAQAITGYAMNGWLVWRYKNKKGNWVRLNELRK